MLSNKTSHWTACLQLKRLTLPVNKQFNFLPEHIFLIVGSIPMFFFTRSFFLTMTAMHMTFISVVTKLPSRG